MSGACVYFIKTATDPSFLKVGKSRNFKSRLRQLQGSWPMTLEVIGKIECASEEDAFRNEKECFARLRRFRLRGEWFRFDDASSLIVNELLSLPAPPLVVKERLEKRRLSNRKANETRRAKQLEMIGSVEFQERLRSIGESYTREILGA